MSCPNTTKSKVAKGYGSKLRQVHEGKESVLIRGDLSDTLAKLVTVDESRR
jgi:hypothetical protein